MMTAAVFEQLDSASEIVIQEFLGTGLSIDTGEDAGIRRTIKHPVRGRNCGQIGLIADVSDADVDPEGPEKFEIRLTSLAEKIVDAGDLDPRQVLKKSTGDDGARKTADSGDEEVHEREKAKG